MLKEIDIIFLEYHYKGCEILEKELKDNGFIIFYSTIPEMKENIGFIKAVNIYKKIRKE